MTDVRGVVYGANEICTVADGELTVHEESGLVVVDDEVFAVGPTDDIVTEHPPENADWQIDATGKTVVPGFVDPHTHALFAGDRSDEFEAKLEGKPYQEILSEGGGILRTVQATREASDDRLLSNLLGHLDTMLGHGTTTVEVKSGYGLDTETELRMLEIVERADRRHAVDVVPTFMGAHAVPETQSADEYTEDVIREQLPAVADQGIAEFCDVFCEDDAFSVEQSRRILEKGLEFGLTPKIHADEFGRIGGTVLSAELGAASADHLLHSNSDDVDAVVDSTVTPVFLPGTAFSLGAEYADARAFVEAGADVALATDFNPNCFSHSMGFACSLACTGMNMPPAESIVAATRNAAHAIDRVDGEGTLAPGTPADFQVVDHPTHVHIPYNFAINRVETVIKDGELVYGA